VNNGDQIKEAKVNEIVDSIKKIFVDEKLDVLIGYEKGSLPLRGTPCFVESADDLDRVIFDFTCHNNIAKYLADEKKRPGDPRKVGIIAKGCDARAIAQLIVEDQYPREKVVIIGVPCTGVIDPAKLRVALSGKDLADYKIEGDNIILIGDDFKIELPRIELLQGGCLSCKYPNAPQYDYFIGEPAKPIAARDEFAIIEDLASKPADERWAYFENEYSACTRCYACRNACPLCYCEECFVDRSMPAWLGKGNELSDNIVYHIVRVLHLAGRCVDCGACAAACPLGIDVRIIGKRIEKEVLDRFGYVAGLDFETQPALAAFREDDKEEFIM